MIRTLRTIRGRIYHFIEKIYWRSLTTKYLIDEPQGEYQPFPFQKNLSRSLRALPTKNRWEIMWKCLENESIESVKDVGCCMGYFCHLAALSGCLTFGFDRNLRFITICNFISKRMGLSTKQSFSLFDATPETIKYIPVTDVTILLSVWHHWYFEFGAQKAKQMLGDLILSTNKVLFFESGEDEIWSEFKLPNLKLEQKCSDWLESYLNEFSNVKVERILESETASYTHYSQITQRTLFAVSRL